MYGACQTYGIWLSIDFNRSNYLEYLLEPTLQRKRLNITLATIVKKETHCLIFFQKVDKF